MVKELRASATPESKCPSCGGVLPADAPMGLCPRCLMAEALGENEVVHEDLDARLEEHGEPVTRPAEALGPMPSLPEATAPVVEKPGDRIGRYRLLQQIGEGGFGVVYLAEQEEPVQRRVALKIIKLGMDTRMVVARFEAERQALALMDHPNIAKVLDGGATSSGRPYFVMELVRGIKITDYCDQHILSTRERLDLFVQVCHGIQHAHQKGIIHRDIKPANILVCLRDGVPAPVVIDFGVAKATEMPLTQRTLFTAFDQFIGTPAYMSPEQAQTGHPDIDTRSDIYAMGVLLYELLTGKTPFDSQELLSVGLEAMRRAIREKEPVRPSTRLHSLGKEELTTAARRRGTDPPKLVHSLRGDLDWIVMKCLEKDRDRRYETAIGLAMDVERHLNLDPITARPPNVAYKVQRFVRRNRLVCGAAVVVAMALVVGLGVSTWTFLRERRARQQANAESRKSLEVANFLKEMLRGVDPDVAQGTDTTVILLLLDSAGKRLDKELRGAPEVEVELRSALATSYNWIGQPVKAEEMMRQAIAVIHSRLCADSGLLAQALTLLGQGLVQAHSFEEAERVLKQALELATSAWGADDPRAASTLGTLGDLNYRRGNLKTARSFHEAALDRLARARGNMSLPVAVQKAELAKVLLAAGELLRSESLMREALAVTSSQEGTGSLALAKQSDLMAQVYRRQGRYAEAEALLRRSIATVSGALGEGHDLTGEMLGELAEVLRASGKPEEAQEILASSPAFRRLPSEPGSIHKAEYCYRHGAALLDLGEWKRSEPLLRESIGIYDQVARSLPSVERAAAAPREALAAVLVQKGVFSEAETLLRQVIAARTGDAEHSPESPHSAERRLIAVLAKQGKYGEMNPLLVTFLASRNKTRDAAYQDLALAARSAGTLLAAPPVVSEMSGPTQIMEMARSIGRALDVSRNPEGFTNLGIDYEALYPIIQLAGTITGAVNSDPSLNRSEAAIALDTSERLLIRAFDAVRMDVTVKGPFVTRVADQIAYLHATRAIKCENRAGYAAAGAWMGKAEGLNRALYWGKCGDAMALECRWQDAQRHFAQAYAAAPDIQYFGFAAAITSALAGASEAYQQQCHLLLEGFSPHVDGSDRTAKACLLMRLPGPDFDLACALADRCASDDNYATRPSWYSFVRCLAEYRRGRHSSAKQWAARTAALAELERVPDRVATAKAVLSITHANAGEADDARITLEQARRLHAGLRTVAARPSVWWQDYAVLELLVREAEQALGEHAEARAAQP